MVDPLRASPAAPPAAASPRRPARPARPAARRVGALAWAAVGLLCAVPAAAAPADELPAVRRLLKDPSPSGRAAAVRRLAGSAEAPALALVVEVLDDPHPYVRRAAAGVLGALLAPEARARLSREARRWKSPTARREACAAFALWLDAVGREALLEALADPEAAVRVEALRWLAEDGDPAVVARVRALTKDADPWVRAEALEAARAGVGLGGLPFAGIDLGPLLVDGDPRVRLSALEAAVARGGAAAADAVVRGLKDVVWSVRLVAADRAAEVRDRRVLEALVPALSDGRRRVAEQAGRALVRLTGLPFEPLATVWGPWLANEGSAFDPAQVEAAPAPPGPRPALGTRTVAGPRFHDLPLSSRHLAFVLDGSGSMAEVLADGRSRWEGVVDELGRALSGLSGAQVNVCVFADAVSPALPRAATLDVARRAALLSFVRGRSPRGHTALYDGIAWALADPEVDTVVVLSDGAPSAGQWFTKTDLLAEVRRANRWRRARIDVVALGVDAVGRRWRDALETLAADSGGTFLRR